MSVSNNKTEYLISSQVPQFIKDDHETFVNFLEEYYSFLAQEGQMEYVSKNFLNYLNIDLIKQHIDTDDDLGEDSYYYAFLQKLYDNFITLLPQKILADKALILKHAKDFYRARGSEKSVRFLLRILLNKEVSEDFGFYYPKRDILRASDGKWFIENSVRIRDIAVNNTSNSIAYNNFINKTIVGQQSKASAIVESIDKYFDSGVLVTELKLSNLFKSFISGETVYCYYTEDQVDKFLSANLFSGIVSSISLVDGGLNYIVGDSIPIEGGGGSGAHAIIASTTRGLVTGIGVSYGGAGFRSNDPILITGGDGSGAAANILSVDTTGVYHPNSYNIFATQIVVEANTLIGNTVYSNLNNTNANSWIANGLTSWSFSNCGPIITCLVLNSGNGYSVIPSTTAQGNTTIRSLGILGRLDIVNGGTNYQIGDTLEFYNQPGTFGFGASGVVSNVDANGAITNVSFVSIGGNAPGGYGYTQTKLPIVNVSSANGNGANIVVKTTLGTGETLVPSTSTIGKILKITLTSGGSGYTSAPTVNLANMSSGSGGIATATIASGIYTYPGRYINDDGHLSGYNFLEDKDYYQNYSYVVRIDESLKNYRKPLLDLTHPAGTRLFGEYLIESDNNISTIINVAPSTTNSKFYLSTYAIQTDDCVLSGVYNVKSIVATYTPTILPGTFTIRPNQNATYNSFGSTIVVESPLHRYVKDDIVYLKFANATANITNGLYTITSAVANAFYVAVANGNTSFVVHSTLASNLTASTGYGTTNNYVVLSHLAGNSDIKLAIGDSFDIAGDLSSIVDYDANSNTIVVFPGVTGNLLGATVLVTKAPYNAYGNVTVVDTVISLAVPSSQLIPGQNVYVNFKSSDTSLANDRYTLLTANSKVLRIRHRNAANAVSNIGNVNVHTNVLTITSNNHSLANRDNVFLTFTSGDLANVANQIYVVGSAATNTFNVSVSNAVVSGGNVTAKTSEVTITIDNHGFANNDRVYLWFTSGDTSNLVNGYYTTSGVTTNTISIIDESIPSANGNASVYRNFMNVTINRTSHGFVANNNVTIMLETGDLANVANGIYRVTAVANANTFNIKHDGITISGNLNNLVSNSNGQIYISTVV